MGAADEREAIGKLFRDEWGGRTPVAYPNVQFGPPQNGMWARFSIVQGDAEQLELGDDNPYHRFVGVVFVQLFGQLGVGDGELRILGDAAASIFRRRRIEVPPNGGILFRTPQVRDNGSDEKHYQMIMSVPYIYDTTF